MTTQNNSRPPKGVSVRILDKEYHVTCPPSAESDLRASAQYLDRQMKLIRRTGKVVGLDRIAVMAGLNTAHELLKATRSTPPVVKPTTLTHEDHNPAISEKLTELKNRIDEALASHPPALISADAPKQPKPATTCDTAALLWPEEENSLQVNALEVEY